MVENACWRSDPAYENIHNRARRGLTVWRGVSLDHHPADPGDFGAGLYHTTVAARARVYAGRSGQTCKHILVLRNAFILGVQAAYDLAEFYGTIHGTTAERLGAARRLTFDLRSLGHDGFIAVHARRDQYTELEVVHYEVTDEMPANCA